MQSNRTTIAILATAGGILGVIVAVRISSSGWPGLGPENLWAGVPLALLAAILMRRALVGRPRRRRMISELATILEGGGFARHVAPESLARDISVAATRVLGCDRAGFWMTDAEGGLTLLHRYDADWKLHEDGEKLPQLEVLADHATRMIVANEVFAEPRLREHHAEYFVRHGIVGVLDVVVRTSNGLVGILRCESRERGRTWNATDVICAGVLGDRAQINFDAHERKKIERQLEEKENRCQVATLGADLGLWEWDLLHGRLIADAHCAKMIGGEPVTMDLPISAAEELIHVDDRKTTSDSRARHTNGETDNFECEYRIRHRNGHFIWVHEVGRVVERTKDGMPMRAAGTRVDITRRKEAEIEAAALRKRHADVLETAPIAVVRLNRRGEVTDWNRHAEVLFGHTPVEAMGVRLSNLLLPQDARVRFDHWIECGLVDDRSNGLGERQELVALDKSGCPVAIEIIANISDGPEGPAINAFMQDIRERKLIESELIEAKESAECANRAKSEFLATMSHEIRTPMNGILGFADLLLDSEITGTPREYAETIRRCAGDLLRLINDILDLSRIEAGKLNVESMLFEAREEGRRVIDLVAPRAAEKLLRLQFNWPDSVPTRIVADPMRFRQVLLNLVGNAVKFTSNGHVAVNAKRGANNWLLIEVEDTGVGIAESAQSKLFTKFSQEDSSTTRRFGGSGLGLAISKQLVELMGGTMGFRSSAGAGSTFWFALPTDLPATISLDDRNVAPTTRRCDDLAPPAAAIKDIRTKDALITAAQPCRVLLAEDNLVNQRLAARILQDMGCTVDVVPNGLEACRLADADSYDVVLMDCHMPVMDGLAATVEIRRRERVEAPTPKDVKHLPIVALTASVLERDREACLTAGMDDFLAKPFTRDAMRAIIRRYRGDS